MHDSESHPNPTGGLPQKSNCGVGALVDLEGGPSHDTITDALELLENLDHRGARGADPNTGDGAGILIQTPHAFFDAVFDDLPDPDAYGVGQFFFPRDADHAPIEEIVEKTAAADGYEVLEWRDVPTENDDLGPAARETEPAVRQAVVVPTTERDPADIDADLYVLRERIESAVATDDPVGADRFYICSLDRRTIVYKGLLTNAQVRSYYPDLRDERVESELALVHSRFSTNTLGAWHLAHPYRNVIHNGEINTLRGNRNWMAAREADLASDRIDIDAVTPVAPDGTSDTASIDATLELLVEGGRSIPHALRMLIPEAWEGADHMDERRQSFYQYHSTINEPWDGPALVVYTDGTDVGAILDRNGLRPARYVETSDGRVVMASERGVLDLGADEIDRTDRLEPGELFFVDGEAGRLVPDDEVFDRLADAKYAEWLADNERGLADLDGAPIDGPFTEDLPASQQAFGYTLDHVERLLEPMASDGKDPIGAMGNDTPLSVLSNRNKTLFSYFKQLFAQVSNPPIDYIREDTVTALDQHLGRQRNLLDESPEHCRQLRLDSPVLTREEGARIEHADEFGATTIDTTFDPEQSLEDAVEDVRAAAVDAIESGAEVLYLTDRAAGPDRLAIPSLLAVAGVHHHLVREGLRTHAGIVVESGQPVAVHHFATLVGYGAEAIVPTLAYESIEDLVRDGIVEHEERAALDRYRGAIEDGLQKVMAKMGISTLESYVGAQIFEAVGLDSAFVAEYFEGTTARTEGITIDDLESDLRERHEEAYDTEIPGNLDLDQGGEFYWRRDGEFHQWNPNTIGALQRATNHDDPEAYDEFARRINDQNEQLQTLRGLLEFQTDERESIPIEEVQPVEEITQRFFSSSMSFGSISPEAHETLAEGMNRVGGFASTGEGGEPTERFGTERECADKQVASGRFGVTANYLANAEHIEIKMAQGSKPGEGGHLPGEKVNDLIAETRSTTPGVPLISPPPHHDIYSIEDLAQLIHDLKCSNSEADVHVKLVSEAGVGIIAAGVAKANADAVLISGHSGGTGASPKTSIKNAGLPWELGIAEANSVLLDNDLRSRIRVRVDGGMKTGRDVAIAAALGAEEYGFGTAPLITCGCVMLRKCHCNTCSVGVATQDPELRDKFPGDPAFVARYMRFIAQEVREILADLGVESVDELIGRTDLLAQKAVDHDRADGMDLSGLLDRPDSEDDPYKTREQNHSLDEKFDHTLIEQARPAIEDGESVRIHERIGNEDRTVGTMLSHAVAAAHGEEGLPEDAIHLDLTGTGGQSLGAFLAAGITLDLTGDANDYAGKGLSGGRLVVRTPDDANYEAHQNVVTGNVALYGATDGEAYFNGVAGERFAVRNSGVKTVVEGVGDHGCEYMTGGIAVVLGETGKNFGAGMSGGEAYVYDESGDFEERVNTEMVHTEPLDDRDRRMVKRLIENHVQYTKSDRGQEILDQWDDLAHRFVKVMPDAYASVIQDRLAEGEDIRIDPPVPSPGITPTTDQPTGGDD
ncbi:glutamate synthase large subunit [Halococcoides cellulosivorans]|uniref:Glutamate synthase large subunit n=1 Tax=Halococcoides cellulosivorans TaxID=1679096 RepID=A0A2R4WZ09_9EURY|nr:glutamate synthase large subunit [Halococcoides cellulosivorans]AWB26771.1 glutamate synthase large subunit [Halococcoides cellulosivorans]